MNPRSHDRPRSSVGRETLPRIIDRRRGGAWIAAALAVVLLGYAAAASSARAGTYRVVECGDGAGRGDLHFAGARGSAGGGGCAGRGLLTRHEARTAERGASGGWRLRIPDGVRVTRVAARLRGRPDAGHRARAEIGAAGQTRSWSVAGSRRILWSGERATRLWAGLACERRGGCGEGRRAVVAIRSVVMRAADAVAPSLEISGDALAPGSRRGTQLLRAEAADGGAGVHRVSVEVNGRVAGVRLADCAKRGQTAERLQPCPRAAEPIFALDTNAAAFRQGPNVVRVCVSDWAERSRGNDRCRTRGVRVDNACPVSERGGDGRIVARVVRHGGERRVSGRLLGVGGEGLEDRTVCVATRIKLRRRAERVVAIAQTDGDGGFAAELGRGPNREVRVAFWPNDRDVVERRMHLREPTRPGLRVRPGRLRNGGRARFRVALPGPNRGGVRVRIEARSGGRWLELRAGRTNSRGRLATRYRFRATTAQRRYSFRAVVPAQPGYPYGRGASKPRRIRVNP